MSVLSRFLNRGSREIRAVRSSLSGEWTVVFAGSFPGGAVYPDGYTARAAVVDEILHPQGRIYVDTTRSQPDAAVRVLGDDTILISTGGDLRREAAVMPIVAAAGRTYIHSLFGASARMLRNVLSLHDVTHIWDVHGAVPEECTYRGNVSLAVKMEALEAVVARQASRIVTVSDAMTRHLIHKHGIPRERFILLPAAADSHAPTPRDLSFVYSGGVDGWQGFRTMVDTINQSSLDARFALMVTNPERARALLGVRAPDPRIVVTSETPQASRRRLRTFAYGFCLREDLVLNRVACPTKLVDYIAAGVVPVLSFADIGDFANHGLQSLSLEAFRAGRIPSEPERAAMAARNLKVLGKLNARFRQGERVLLSALASPTVPAHKGDALHA